jgi:hypothetical protein
MSTLPGRSAFSYKKNEPEFPIAPGIIACAVVRNIWIQTFVTTDDRTGVGEMRAMEESQPKVAGSVFSGAG